MFRLFKRPFATKLCLGCVNYKDGMCLKSIKEKSFITGKITYQSAEEARFSLCGPLRDEPYWFKSNLSNMENDLNENKKSCKNFVFLKFINFGLASLNLGYLLNGNYNKSGVIIIMPFIFGLHIGLHLSFSEDLKEKRILVNKTQNDIDTIKNYDKNL